MKQVLDVRIIGVILKMWEDFRTLLVRVFVGIEFMKLVGILVEIREGFGRMKIDLGLEVLPLVMNRTHHANQLKKIHIVIEVIVTVAEMGDLYTIL